MIPKITEKDQAIKLRREGLSYREILARIPVAKSTLSLWLRSVHLAKQQKQRLTEKRLAAVYRGAEAKRRQRIELTKVIKNAAIKDIKKITKRELWLMGIMLYWAEGSKEKSYRAPSAGVIFSNSDPAMISLYLRWIQEILKIPNEDIIFAIYIHENCKERVPQAKQYWSQVTGFGRENFERVYFKKNCSRKR